MIVVGLRYTESTNGVQLICAKIGESRFFVLRKDDTAPAERSNISISTFNHSISQCSFL